MPHSFPVDGAFHRTSTRPIKTITGLQIPPLHTPAGPYTFPPRNRKLTGRLSNPYPSDTTLRYFNLL